MLIFYVISAALAPWLEPGRDRDESARPSPPGAIGWAATPTATAESVVCRGARPTCRLTGREPAARTRPPPCPKCTRRSGATRLISSQPMEPKLKLRARPPPGHRAVPLAHVPPSAAADHVAFAWTLTPAGHGHPSVRRRRLLPSRSSTAGILFSVLLSRSRFPRASASRHRPPGPAGEPAGGRGNGTATSGAGAGRRLDFFNSVNSNSSPRGIVWNVQDSFLFPLAVPLSLSAVNGIA